MGTASGSDDEDITGHITETHNNNNILSNSRTFTENISIRDLLSM
jgi:hypothetical protein